jgi:tetratricopeptide (TPR) repeat protein
VTPFDELMKQAEAQLKEGDYLSAGDTYQMAVRSEPNNPLAILGRGNAELAAGMYQSASSDLEFVFEKKPELISVKYALGDYIPVKRQGQLVADLGTLAQSKTTGNMASFLLCYLCYQTGRNEELHAELDRWAARPWKDQWQTIAEKAWR